MAFVWHFTQANAICYYIGFQLVKRLYGIMKIFFNFKLEMGFYHYHTKVIIAYII
jgi:hypothetical protein